MKCPGNAVEQCPQLMIARHYTIQGQTAPLGTYTTVEGPAGSEESRNHETRKQRLPGVLEACEECV